MIFLWRLYTCCFADDSNALGSGTNPMDLEVKTNEQQNSFMIFTLIYPHVAKTFQITVWTPKKGTTTNI